MITKWLLIPVAVVALLAGAALGGTVVYVAEDDSGEARGSSCNGNAQWTGNPEFFEQVFTPEKCAALEAFGQDGEFSDCPRLLE
jgi:hypothetical protein